MSRYIISDVNGTDYHVVVVVVVDVVYLVRFRVGVLFLDGSKFFGEDKISSSCLDILFTSRNF